MSFGGNVYAEIVSIGHELLMGEIQDSNAAYLASRLPALGIQLRWVSTVGDDTAHLAEVLDRSMKRSQITFTTGGLGPTMDDLTREAIAQLMEEQITEDPHLRVVLEERLNPRGIQVGPANLKQATIIPSAVPIPNSQGTAPGWWVERDGNIIISMPGPPAELEVMWEQEVVPRLRERVRGTVIVSRTLKTFGLSEALLDEMVSPVAGSENPYMGIYAKPDGIWVRFISQASTEEAAYALLRPVEEEVRSILGDAVWGVDQELPEERVGTLLRAKGLTLACMESCSGGLLASSITEIPGSSEYFKGGVVSYSNTSKIAFGVSPEVIEKYGAVSSQTAEAMALAVSKYLGSDIGISITGVAGPSELDGRPVGEVYIGLAHDGTTSSVVGHYPPRRPLVKRRATMGALLELWRLLKTL